MVGSYAYREFEDPLDEPSSNAEDAAGCDMMCEDPDLFCESHLHFATPAALRRMDQMRRRLAFIQEIWNDQERFDAVVSSGRYLKLCNLTEWVSDYEERATARVKNEVLATRRKSAA